MINKGKHNVLGIQVNAMDYDAAVSAVISAAEEHRPLAVSALAVHGVMTGVLDETHRYRLNHLDLVLPDGQPVRWALNLLHHIGLRDRLYGPTLTLKVCEEAARRGIPIYLYGSRGTVLEALTNNLKSKFPGIRIAGCQPSHFRQLTPEEQEQVFTDIRNSGAAIVFVGLGCPRQEVWVYENSKHLSMPLLAVGAAFDFHAGLLSQAPPYLQNVGLEWLYRLSCEPKRLWKRYAYLNPLYLWLLALQLTGIRRFNPERATEPSNELRYG
jgi:N-acetylglucosaminyldiphosphoundecaprenol N-acetyl-beta-D-mannosaminyltransferase